MMVLVFGKTGQVARELKSLLPDATFLGREEVDLIDSQSCFDAVVKARPSFVINAAAYTAVDAAEADERAAELVNGVAPGAIALACAELGIGLLHISTDYVFDGAGSAPFVESHPTAPLSAYGRTKLAGEQAIRASGVLHIILRTSWVFSAHGNNFVKTMVRLSKVKDSLTVVSDQIGGPTSARDIAEACIEIMQQFGTDNGKVGTYHYSGTPNVSWASFAREIFSQIESSVIVTDIPTSEYPTPAKRPGNSRLDCTKLKAAFNLDQPNWKVALSEVLSELESQK